MLSALEDQVSSVLVLLVTSRLIVLRRFTLVQCTEGETLAFVVGFFKDAIPLTRGYLELVGWNKLPSEGVAHRNHLRLLQFLEVDLVIFSVNLPRGVFIRPITRFLKVFNSRVCEDWMPWVVGS